MRKRGVEMTSEINNNLNHIFGLLVNRDIYLKKLFLDIPLITYLESDKCPVHGATKEILIRHAKADSTLKVSHLKDRDFLLSVNGIGAARANRVLSVMKIALTKRDDTNDYTVHLYHWIYRHYL